MQAMFRSAIGAGLAMAVALGGCARAPVRQAPAPAPAQAGLLTVQQRNAPDYKMVSAVLTNRDIGDARARIGGTLQRVLVHEGDDVRRGQVLAVVADQSLALQAQSGAASVVAAQAIAERAQNDQRRYQVLYAQGFLSQAGMDQVNASARAAEAQLRAARAQAGAQAAVSDQGRVLAPADGRVTRLPIPQGAVVMPGDVVVAISTGARVLRLELPEADASFLAQGQEIRVLAEAGSGPTPRLARVRQIYPAVANGRVTVDLDASDLQGDFVGARVRVLAPTGQRQAFVIPANYIVTRFGVDYVRLVRSGGVIEAPVQRGASLPLEDMPNGVEILSGLRNGDQILPIGAGA
jgi:RND family efflux transporter MFP subunit